MIKIEGYTLHAGQQRIKNEIFDKNTKYNIINCSRQFGKSVLLSQILLYYNLNYKNVNTAYVTPTYKLGKTVFRQIIKNLEKSEIIKSRDKSELRIEFINGSEIQFMSADKPDNLRGYAFDYLFIDEFSFMKCEDVWTAVRPTMNVRGKKCFITSTPFGRNKFYEFSKLGENPDHKNWSYYFGIYSENPYYDINEVEDARKTLPDKIYRQEYLAEFVDDGGVVFDNINKACNYEKFGEYNNNDKYYAGIDLGNINDFTVCVIINQKNEVVDIYRKNHSNYTIIYKELLEFIKKYNAAVYIETNVENTVYELIKGEYNNIHPIKTTNKSKNDYIEKLIREFQDQSIYLPSDRFEITKILKTELQQFSYKYNIKTHIVSYGAEEPLHDDTIISLALANLARINLKHYGNFLVV